MSSPHAFSGTMAAAAGVVAGAGCCVAFASAPRPLLRGWRLPYAAALAVNVAAVSIDGRFDSLAARGGGGGSQWPTLLAPAGFAFAIWGVIYLGEACGLVQIISSAWRRRPQEARRRLLDAQAPGEGGSAGAAAPLERAVRASNEAFVGANVAQALWCLSFRPWAVDVLWVPTLCLGAAAGCLYVSQRRLLAASRRRPTGSLALIWPRSLHLGWLLAATLVNANGYVGKAGAGPPAALGFAACSVAAAAVAGSALLLQGMPTAAASLAWALFAASKGAPAGADAAALGPLTIEGLARAEGAIAAALGLAVALAAARAAAAAIQRAAADTIALGSSNPAKLAACALALESFGLPEKVVGVQVESGVAPQPVGLDETMRGARQRAAAALRASPEAALGLGLESGLVSPSPGAAAQIDICACAIALCVPGEEALRFSEGWSSGFLLPPRVAEAVAALGYDGAFAKAGISPDPWCGGALAGLSDGVVSRESQMRSAVEMAIVALRSRKLYAEEDGAKEAVSQPSFSLLKLFLRLAGVQVVGGQFKCEVE